MNLHDSEDIKPDEISIKPEFLKEEYFEEAYILTENGIKQELSLFDEISIEVKHETVEDLGDRPHQFDANPDISTNISVVNTYCVCPTVGCGLQFEGQSLLKKHIVSNCEAAQRLLTVNSKKCQPKIVKTDTQEANVDNKDYLCVEVGCRGRFKGLSLLENHFLACHGSRRMAFIFHCSMCDAQFNSKQELDKHKTNFYCNKPKHTCHRCKKDFSFVNSLFKHEKKSIKFICKCGQLICTNREYKRHKKLNCKPN